MRLDSAKLDALIRAGQLFHARGWVPASGGNFSVRSGDAQLAITASGCHKGELQTADFMPVDLQGRSLEPGRRSSAETLLHCQLYRHFPDVHCVLHTHSVASTLLSRAQAQISLQDYELLKILDGVDTHSIEVVIPVFANDQDIARLAAQVDAAMAEGGARHGYLIRGHGLYTWGATVEQARYRVEALEFLFECELKSQSLGRSP